MTAKMKDVIDNLIKLVEKGNNAQVERLMANVYKTTSYEDMTLYELMTNFEKAYVDAKEDMTEDNIDYLSLKYKFADIANYCHMLINYCNKELNM